MSRRIRHTSTEYKAWQLMRERCANEENYAGRGITVCIRWNSSSKAFLADMGPKPSPDHSLDRIDNAGNYDCGRCPDCTARGITRRNCRWATDTEQARNKRNNRLIEHASETRCLAEWAEVTGLPRYQIAYRLDVLGWSVARALTEPLRGAPAQTAILLALAAGPRTIREIWQVVGDSVALYQMLDRMRRTGAVRRVGRGLYERGPAWPCR